MAQDDSLQQIASYLSAISKEISHYTTHASDAVERSFDSAGATIRETWSSQTWLPEFARPRIPQTPPSRPKVAPPLTLWQTCTGWVASHGPLTAVSVVVVLGTGVALYRRRRNYTRKRRAKRATNGARREIVVVAGQAGAPLTRAIVLDLERRGFIVYVLVGSRHEEDAVKNEGRADVLPLHMNVADSVDVRDTIAHFQRLLATPQYATTGAMPHVLSLAGLVVVPDTTYPTGPVEMVPLELWSDSMHAKFLSTVGTIQSFLSTLSSHQSRLVMITPSIIQSLAPPFHGVETSLVSALEGFTSTLRREMDTLGVSVCHIQIGHVNLGRGSSTALQRSAHADVLSWPGFARSLYGANYLSQSQSQSQRGSGASGHGGGSPRPSPLDAAGSPARVLHNAVFDALALPRAPSGIVRVGRGSTLYGLVGMFAPDSLVAWMLRISRTRPFGQVKDDEASRERLDTTAQWEKIDAAV